MLLFNVQTVTRFVLEANSSGFILCQIMVQVIVIDSEVDFFSKNYNFRERL